MTNEQLMKLIQRILAGTADPHFTIQPATFICRGNGTQWNNFLYSNPETPHEIMLPKYNSWKHVDTTIHVPGEVITFITVTEIRSYKTCKPFGVAEISYDESKAGNQSRRWNNVYVELGSDGFYDKVFHLCQN